MICADRATHEIDPAGVLTLVYDDDGDLVERIDRKGWATTYVYDALGHGVSTTDPDGHTTGYIYDAVGNPRVKSATAGAGPVPNTGRS